MMSGAGGAIGAIGHMLHEREQIVELVACSASWLSDVNSQAVLRIFGLVKASPE